MIRTEEYTFKNDQRYFTNGDLISILHVHFFKAIAKRVSIENFIRLTRSQQRKYKNNANEECYHIYRVCKEIIISKIIAEFIEWRPFIKGFNLVKIESYLVHSLNIPSRYNSRYSNINFDDNNDHKILTLCTLTDIGLNYLYYEDIPLYVETLMRIVLYGPLELKKLFDFDYRTGIAYMSHFSNETDRHWGRRDWSQYGYHQIDDHYSIKKKIEKKLPKPKAKPKWKNQTTFTLPISEQDNDHIHIRYRSDNINIWSNSADATAASTEGTTYNEYPSTPTSSGIGRDIGQFYTQVVRNGGV